MIVTTGKNVIKKYFGGQASDIGTHLAFGIGSTAVALTDTALGFEVLRVPVTASADLDNNRIVFKGQLPTGSIYKVNEVGLILGALTPAYNVLPLTRNLLSAWTVGTLSATAARFSDTTLAVAAAANATTMAENTGLQFDMAKYDSTDSVVVAFQADANLSSLRIRIGSDAANYREFVISSPATGYQIVRITLSAGSTTGTPDLANAGYVAVRPSAKAAGATTVYLDAIRVEDNAPVGDTLVARTVIGTPVATDLTVPTDVEYSLVITV